MLKLLIRCHEAENQEALCGTTVSASDHNEEPPQKTQKPKKEAQE